MEYIRGIRYRFGVSISSGDFRKTIGTGDWEGWRKYLDV
jgi:hypothetical protein